MRLKLLKNRLRSGQAVLPPILAGILQRVAIFQVCITIGFEIVLVLGALSAQKLTGSDRIFGMATTTIFATGQLVIALPVGKWMDKYGRRSILLIGSLAETVALVMIGIALLADWPIWFSLGLVALGLGSGAAQMAYLIGGDVFPSSRRAEGLGIMTTSIAIGIVGGPYLVGLISDLATTLRIDPVITPWFSISAVTAIASWLMYGLHPEPLEVARNLHAYFPSDPGSIEVPAEDEPSSSHSLRDLLGYYPIIASVGIMICFQGVRLSLVPLLTYILHARNYSLSSSSLMVAAMGLGMVLASSLVGTIGDRWGRKKLLLLAILVGAICAALLPLVSSFVIMFLLLLTLGMGYSSALTMTRVIITDATGSHEHGTAMALHSIAMGIAVVVFPTISSYTVSLSGWSTMTWVGIGLMSLALLLTLFLREIGIGKWDHPGMNDGRTTG